MLGEELAQQFDAIEQFVFPEIQQGAFSKMRGLVGVKDEAYQHVPMKEFSIALGKGSVKCSLDRYVEPLSQAKVSYGLYLGERLKRSVKRSDALTTLLQHAFMDNGVMIYLPSGTVIEEPVELNVTGHAHIFVVAEANVEVKFVMRPDMHHCFVDLNVHKNAHVKWLIDGVKEVEHTQLIHMESEQQRDSNVTIEGFFAGSKMTRLSVDAELKGEGAYCDVSGLSALREKSQVHIHSTIQHLAPNTQSNQLMKNLLSGSAKTSFTGKIFVDQIAQGTQAYQLNRNLIVSPDAAAHAKPNLEIFADDVKASHGATIANIDEELRFYFHTRGLNAEESRKFLVRAFCDEMLNRLSDKSEWQKHIQKVLA